MLRSFIIIVVALALTTTAFALAAGNTVDTSKAGDGSAAVSGYAVTNITYNLNAVVVSGRKQSLDARYARAFSLFQASVGSMSDRCDQVHRL